MFYVEVWCPLNVVSKTIRISSLNGQQETGISRENSQGRKGCIYQSSNWFNFGKSLLLKALVNEDTLLRTHCCPWCFLGCANWETFVADTKRFWTKSETFLCPGHKICVRNKCCASRQTGKHLCRQQCVRNNVSSFARALSRRWRVRVPLDFCRLVLFFLFQATEEDILLTIFYRILWKVNEVTLGETSRSWTAIDVL